MLSLEDLFGGHRCDVIKAALDSPRHWNNGGLHDMLYMSIELDEAQSADGVLKSLIPDTMDPLLIITDTLSFCRPGPKLP